MEKQLLSVKDMADILAISVRSVWRRRDEGSIPQPLKLGGNTRWRRDVVERWIAAGCEELA